ncbi:hypothetical protein H0G86_002739 [Trichoderma simmonsii]|uniref:C2H2-type domain-containing protein n=1 Tax=Trichoderma simmonsii TaxID=1491479 RepID=A0A8G0PCG9_9HYPO|nr:hypothetical protein H0G86_002739 [Trichoderma simmonsii]
MSWDGNGAFKPGAANPPLLADETYGEEDQSFSGAVADTITNEFTEHNASIAQEWGVRPTLDPSILHSSPPTPPGVASGIIDPSMLEGSGLTTPGVALGSPFGVQERTTVVTSNDLYEAEDHMAALDNSSPLSFFSDFSSSDLSFEDDLDAMNLDTSGPLAAGTLVEYPPSSGTEANSLAPAGSPTVALPFVCDRDGCSKSFEKNYQLNRHLGWHDKKLQCPLHPGCDKRYQYKKDLEKHIWSHHQSWAESTGRPPIRTKCKICGVILERPDNAKRHMDEVHKKIRRRRGPGG